jgi:hypothetical protein
VGAKTTEGRLSTSYSEETGYRETRGGLGIPSDPEFRLKRLISLGLKLSLNLKSGSVHGRLKLRGTGANVDG